MSENRLSGRPACAACLRAQQSCICRWRRPLTPVPQVLILQHQMEIHQAKGSGRLLHLCLQGSMLVHGERFQEEVLHGLLYSPAALQPVLLYPGTQDASSASNMPDLSAPAGLRLVILDATWRKSRKMLHLNPLLQQLPRLPLIDSPASRYRIRKAHRADQLSTFEAACHALAKLEEDDDKYVPLLQAFDGFVAQQRSYLPEDALLNDPLT